MNIVRQMATNDDLNMPCLYLYTLITGHERYTMYI